MEITKFSEKESVRIFEKSGKRLELAIIMAIKSCSVSEAEKAILLNNKDFNKILNN